MPQALLALGAAAVTVSGCVWYLPALADLRAGADRPVSRRKAAAACLSGWTTAGIVALLLLVSPAWWVPSTAAVAGTAVTVGLRARAAVQRRRERREAARDWAELGHDRRPPDIGRARNVVAVLIAFGAAAAVAVAGLGVVAEPGGARAWWCAAVPSSVVALFLALAVVWGRALRRDRVDASDRRR
ncbi:hypothetical protein LK08_02515 [Streptomyces sp. MUSC 125]|uniref:hypothetical protein n=1 Tax=Streptomyces TaxID=1883 RepID=UPI0005756AF3|nr:MULTISPECIES: hypothetical protein [Streptomyces]ARP73384.1 hypothetical protein LK06_029225 [Streptomyces pluripotens]KIE28550.1 hypothetical protein LK08_02515 [Streptomyces sp. MUSC 125]MCH0560313.1 hypothetical protein [Streptomyces sp. MUM 16J]